MKLSNDEEQEVADLFNKSVRVGDAEVKVDMSVKKFAFRIATNIQNEIGNSKLPLDKIWRKFFMMEEKDQFNEVTKKPFFDSLEDFKLVF
jgi:hypothetical protein